MVTRCAAIPAAGFRRPDPRPSCGTGDPPGLLEVRGKARHIGGTTDSFGPDLRPVTSALGFLPYANGVHYDSEAQRRPKFHRFIADGTLPGGYATDDGTGLLYRGTELAEAVTEVRGKGAYRVTLSDGQVREEPLQTRLLPGSA